MCYALAKACIAAYSGTQKGHSLYVYSVYIAQHRFLHVLRYLRIVLQKCFFKSL